MTCDFTSFFNSISVISGRFLDDNERLCAMVFHSVVAVGGEGKRAVKHDMNFCNFFYFLISLTISKKAFVYLIT